MEKTTNNATVAPRGRFAPSPSGRMHLGNIYTALVSWLSVRAAGGKWILRIEDLDPFRSKPEYARLIEEDLRRLGLDWDEGGINGKGMESPCMQSLRHHLYADASRRLADAGLTYGCRCRRAEILATQAPHQSDGRIVYSGKCRPCPEPPFPRKETEGTATRLYVPDIEIGYSDRMAGYVSFNLAKECGDFMIRRTDGAWAYQLAVVADDHDMGITEVVRGCDLLLSGAQQKYLYGLLGATSPEFAHLPLICNENGQRLSKRDKSLGLDELFSRHNPEEIIGMTAHLAGITERAEPCQPKDLIAQFDWKSLRRGNAIIVDAEGRFCRTEVFS